MIRRSLISFGWRVAIIVAVTLGLYLAPIGLVSSHGPQSAVSVEDHAHGHSHDLDDVSEDHGPADTSHGHGHNPGDHSHETPSTPPVVTAALPELAEQPPRAEASRVAWLRPSRLDRPPRSIS